LSLRGILKREGVTEFDKDELDRVAKTIETAVSKSMLSAGNKNAQVTKNIIRELLIESSDSSNDQIQELIKQMIEINNRPPSSSPSGQRGSGIGARGVAQVDGGSALGPATLRDFTKAAVTESSKMGGSKQDVMFGINPRTGNFEAFHSSQGSLANAKRQHAYGQRIRNNASFAGAPSVGQARSFSPTGFGQQELAVDKIIERAIAMSMVSEFGGHLAKQRITQRAQLLTHGRLNPQQRANVIQGQQNELTQLGAFNTKLNELMDEARKHYGGYDAKMETFDPVTGYRGGLRDVDSASTVINPQTGDIHFDHEVAETAKKLSDEIASAIELHKNAVESLTATFEAVNMAPVNPATPQINTSTTVNIESERAEAVVAQVAQATQETLVQIAEQTQQYNPQLSAAIRSQAPFAFSAIKKDKFGRPIQ
jgi:hypothetical protein